MKSGLQLGRWFGIDVVVHWTFLLLLAVLTVTQLLGGASWGTVLGGLTLLCTRVPVRAAARVRPCSDGAAVRDSDVRYHAVADWRSGATGADSAKSVAGVLDRDRRSGGERGDRGRAIPFSAALNSISELLPTNVAAAGFLTQLISHQRDPGAVQPAAGLPDGRWPSVAVGAGHVFALHASDEHCGRLWSGDGRTVRHRRVLHELDADAGRVLRLRRGPQRSASRADGIAAVRSAGTVRRFGPSADHMPLHERTIRTPNGDLWVVWIANDTPMPRR